MIVKLATVSVFVLPSFTPFQRDSVAGDALERISSVSLIVDVDSAGTDLATGKLETDVQLRLRLAGISVQKGAPVTLKAQVQIIPIVHGQETVAHVALVRLRLSDKVPHPRVKAQSLVAVTWETSELKLISGTSMAGDIARSCG